METKTQSKMNYPVFAEKEKFEVETRFVFSENHRPSILGSYVGNINDEEFAKKLDRVRGRLWLRNVNYSTTPISLEVKEVKRKNDRERYERKMKMAWKQFWVKHDQITGLFQDSERQELFKEWTKLVSTLRLRYGQH